MAGAWSYTPRLFAACCFSFFSLVGAGSSGAVVGPQAVDPTGAPPDLPLGDAGVEVAELRTEVSRTFRQEDGTFVTHLFAAPVKYRDEKGRFEPIDSALVTSARSGYALENRSNRYSLSLPRSLGHGPVRFALGEEWVTFQLRGARSAPEAARATGSKAIFTDVLQGVSVDYVAGPTGVKETLTLASASAPSSFVFDLRTSSGLRAKENEFGGIDFLGARGEILFAFAPPFMQDASRSEEGYSTDVTYDLVQTVSGPALTVSADRKWLDDPARVWPVAIDPTVTVGATQDCFIVSGSPTTVSCSNPFVRVGWTSASGMRRGLFKFDTPAFPGTSASITNATLRLNCTTATGTGLTNLDVHRLTQAWDNTATWNRRISNPVTNWTSAGGTFNATIRGTLSTNCSTTGWKTWTVTSLVQEWVGGTFANLGLILKQRTNVNNFIDFVSIDDVANPSLMPQLVITHTNAVPAVPANLAPVTGTSSADTTPTLAGVYADPDFHTGRLEFQVCSAAGCPGGTVVASSGVLPTIEPGEVSTWEPSLAAGQTYHWQARAVDSAGGTSAWSPTLTYATTGDPLLLEAPTRLYGNGALLRWSRPSGATSYEVHRNPTVNFTPSAATLVATIGDPAVTSYRDTTARPGAFTYKIVAGALTSNERSVTLPAIGTATITLDPLGPEASATQIADSTIAASDCQNVGAAQTMRVGTQLVASPAETRTYRSLLSFDLGEVPSGATISSASLSLSAAASPRTVGQISLHRLTQSWNEGSGGGSCSGDGATWLEPRAGGEWAALGGDFDPTAVVTLSPAATAGTHAYTITSLIQGWVSSTNPDLGLLLKLTDETPLAGKYASYYTDDVLIPALRPKLSLTYTDTESPSLAPQAALSLPATGALVQGDVVALKAAASDDGRVVDVRFFLDSTGGTPIATDTSAPYEANWDTNPGVPNGAHTLFAVARDDAGNTTTSAGVPVTVGNSAVPTTSITAPTGGATVTGSTTISANASDDVGVSKVEFYVDDFRLGVDQVSPYSIPWNTLSATLPAYDGAHVLTTRAHDAHGQVTTSAPVNVTVANTTGTAYRAGFTSTASPISVLYDPAAGTQAQHGINVTVVNNSTVTWSSGSIFLRYRWFSPDPTPVVTDGGLISLGSNVAPSGSRLVSLLIPPPTLPDGVAQARYLLRVDLYDNTTSTWFAAAGNQPLDKPVIVTKPLQTALGLERYYQYEGEALGAGMEQLTNVASGDSLLRWTPFQAPGRGLSTVADLTYNSLEQESESPVGNNFSLAISSLLRLGNPLEVHPTGADTLAGRNTRFIEFVDGDGTRHRFEGKMAGAVEYWEEPAGVHLYLREFSTSDPLRKWALTRPDRVTFFFDTDGYPTFVKDGNGNELVFTLENVPARVDPGGPAKRVAAVTDDGGRSFLLDYYSAAEAPTARIRGKLQRLSDHSGSALDFDYYEDGNLLRITQRGGANADGSFLADRTFVFTYTTANGSGPAIPAPANRVNPDPATFDQSTRLYSVRDPRGAETLFTYCSASDCGAAANRWKLKTRTDRAAGVTSFAYDATNRITTVTAPLARETDYAFDTQGSVTQITNPKNEPTALEWSTDRQLTKVTEPTTQFTRFAYNANGYLTDSWNQLGEKTTLAYENLAVDANDVSGKWKAGRTIPHLSQLVEKTSPKGTMTPGDPTDFDWDFDYDANGNLFEVIDPEGNITRYTYNPDGTLATTTDARGVLTTTNPDDFKTQFLDYDLNGFPTRVVDAEGGTTRFGYDADGFLRTVQDPRHAADSGSDTRSYQLTFDYDAFHRLGRQSEPKSTALDRGRLIWRGAAFDPNDNVVAEYGPDYRALDVVTPKQATTYDAMDRLTVLTADRNPAIAGTEQTALAYDAAGRLTKVTLPEGVATVSPATDFTVEYVYDLLDRAITEIRYPKDGSSAGARRTHGCYDLAGDLRWLTAPKAELANAPTTCPGGTPPAFTHTSVYDVAHRLVEEVDALGHTRSFAYDENGNLKTDVNANGDQTRYQMDELDRVNKIVEPFTETPLREITTRLEYDPVGNLARFISPRAWDEAGGVQPFDEFVTSYNYDALNRLVRTDLPTSSADPQAHYIHHTYNANGDLTSTSLPVAISDPAAVPADKKTTLGYFDPGWIRTSNDPGNPLIEFDYTAEGWQALRRPADGERVAWHYFEDGLPKRIDERSGGEITFVYDRNGNLTNATDKDGIAGNRQPPTVICADYDGFDEIAKTRVGIVGLSEEWKVTNFGYDRNGNLTNREDNRTEDDNGIEAVNACPDPPTSSTPGRQHTFTYDAADWVTQQLDQGPLSASTDDRRTTTVFEPTGWEQERKVERFNGSTWETKQTTNWTYFQNGKLSTIETKNRQGVSVETHDVSYRVGGVYMNGHRVEDEFTLQHPGTNTDCKTATPCTATYQYDSRDRLTVFANGHGQTTSYELDPQGNVRTKERTGKPDRTYTYQGDQLLSESEVGEGVVAEYYYDAQGNLFCTTTEAGVKADCKAPAGGSISPELITLAAFDPLNRMTSFRTFGILEPAHIGVEVDRTSYTHDALDRPVEQKERHGQAGPTRTKSFTYLGLSNLLSQELHTNPGVTKTYGYDAFGHRIGMTNTPAGQATKTYGFGYDVHGSVSVLLDDDQNPVDSSYGYDPYGEIDPELTQGTDRNTADPEKPPEDPLNPYRYTAKRLDSGSGSYDMGARRFGTGTGQFLQQDLYLGALANLTLSLDPLTQNRYALAGGAPTSYIETDGHVPAEDGAGGSTSVSRTTARHYAPKVAAANERWAAQDRASSAGERTAPSSASQDYVRPEYQPCMGMGLSAALGACLQRAALEVEFNTHVPEEAQDAAAAINAMYPLAECIDRRNPGVCAEAALAVATSSVGVGAIRAFDKGFRAARRTGIVYLRTDLLGGKPYVGRAMSETQFIQRQSRHSRAYPDADFQFAILGRARPGTQLARLEEYWIRRLGGPTTRGNPEGLLANRRYEMNDLRYLRAGGDPYP